MTNDELEPISPIEAKQMYLDAIIDNLEALEGPVELISQYDLVDRPFGTSPNIDQISTRIQEMSNRQVRGNYIDEVARFIESYT